MIIKYSDYMHLVEKAIDSQYKQNNSEKYSEHNEKSINNDKEFISKNDAELLFPGHIHSYYVSAEF